jgi:hypothetical protein
MPRMSGHNGTLRSVDGTVITEGVDWSIESDSTVYVRRPLPSECDPWQETDEQEMAAGARARRWVTLAAILFWIVVIAVIIKALSD